MVKNKKGGSGHKKLASKNVAPKGGYRSRKVRRPKEDGEMIARVTQMSGGGHAVIKCTDGKIRTLVIRGKFRGRNKRDNFIGINTLVLVGLRSVTMGAVVNCKKLEKADILEIYSDDAKKELQGIPEVFAILGDDKKTEIKNDIDCGVDITNDTTDTTQEPEYNKDKTDTESFSGKFTEEDWDNI
jgi:initiation factor 1A